MRCFMPIKFLATCEKIDSKIGYEIYRGLKTRMDKRSTGGTAGEWRKQGFSGQPSVEQALARLAEEGGYLGHCTTTSKRAGTDVLSAHLRSAPSVE
jgi:hypothetical protein